MADKPERRCNIGVHRKKIVLIYMVTFKFAALFDYSKNQVELYGNANQAVLVSIAIIGSPLCVFNAANTLADLPEETVNGLLLQPNRQRTLLCRL